MTRTPTSVVALTIMTAVFNASHDTLHSADAPFDMLTSPFVRDAKGNKMPVVPIQFQAPHCLITNVQLSSDEIYIEFTGRWDWDHRLNLGLVDVDKNGISIGREPKSDPVTFAELGAQAQKLINCKAKIVVESKLWASRGGIPFVSLPSTQVTFAPIDEK